MFTGIIEQTGIVVEKAKYQQGFKLSVAHSFNNLSLGDSMALNGVCITITDLQNDQFTCDISPETIAKTTLNNLAVRDVVSLERPLTLDKGLGGHFVMGHVDEVVILSNRLVYNDFIEMTFKGIHHQAWLVEKGCITIDGISLTINRLELDAVTCMIIPHTLENTHLGKIEEGHCVNVEYDYLAKLVAKQNSLLLKTPLTS